jgi:hypothetical protein
MPRDEKAGFFSDFRTILGFFCNLFLFRVFQVSLPLVLKSMVLVIISFYIERTKVNCLQKKCSTILCILTIAAVWSMSLQNFGILGSFEINGNIQVKKAMKPYTGN